MKKQNKYEYYRVIQTHHGYGWDDDDDFHETDSQYRPLNRALYLENVKAYKENAGSPVRVVNRKVLRDQNVFLTTTN